MNPEEKERVMMKTPSTAALEKIYGESEVSRKRYESLAENFEKMFHSDKMEFFTAPGRTEIVGNHTDHNGKDSGG